MPDVLPDQHQLLLLQKYVGAACQIVQFTAVNVDQFKRLMLLASKIKITGAFLIKKRVKLLQYQFTSRACKRPG